MSKVDKAIASVMSGVKRLGREDRNGQGGYNYASIDNFLEMTGKLCAAANLAVIMDEEDFSVIPDFVKRRDGKIPGLQMKFAFTLRCDGEQAGPFRRSIIVPSDMGSQAFGAAQSYVLKQFLRATFQIPTGDKGEDLDAHDTGQLEPVAKPEREKPQPLKGKHKTRAALKDAIQGVVAEIQACGDKDQLDAYLATPDAKATVDQCREEHQYWWNGDGMDFIGLSGEIERAYKNLENPLG